MDIVAFDPGRNVGVAFVAPSGELKESLIITVEEIAALPLPAEAVILIGSGTGSRALAGRLLARGLEPQIVDETATTLEAKGLYYRHHPPRGLARLLPLGMRSPAVPLDDYAAYAIALRWLSALQSEVTTSD